MAMRVEWIVVVLAVLPAQLAATALLVVIAPVSAAVLQAKLVWQVSKAARLAHYLIICVLPVFGHLKVYLTCPQALCMQHVCWSFEETTNERNRFLGPHI
jgi:hypothetical protein